MKCYKCPCSYTIQYPEGSCDWECIAGREDEMDEDDEGCNITEEEANDIAVKAEESHMKYFEDFMDWLEREG